MEGHDASQRASPRDLVASGVAAVLFVGLGSAVPLELSRTRCDTSPPDDTSSSWQFSNYCTALHSLHVVNYPDTVSGGGALEGIFALPGVITLVGLLVALRVRSLMPLRRALVFAAALLAVLVVLAVAFAWATYTPVG